MAFCISKILPDPENERTSSVFSSFDGCRDIAIERHKHEAACTKATKEALAEQAQYNDQQDDYSDCETSLN